MPSAPVGDLSVPAPEQLLLERLEALYALEFTGFACRRRSRSTMSKIHRNEEIDPAMAAEIDLDFVDHFEERFQTPVINHFLRYHPIPPPPEPM